MKMVDLDEVIDAIDSTDWYHLFNGKLSEGAEDEDHALYKAEDVYKAIEGVPVVDAIPIKFIESRIEQLSRIADDEFNNNGGYVNEFDYRMWALKGLLQDWEDYQEQEEYEKKAEDEEKCQD